MNCPNCGYFHDPESSLAEVENAERAAEANWMVMVPRECDLKGRCYAPTTGEQSCYICGAHAFYGKPFICRRTGLPAPPVVRYITGTIERFDQYGLAFAKAEGCQWAFTFDKIARYRGETPKELGFVVGLPITLGVLGDKVQSVLLSAAQPDARAGTPSQAGPYEPPLVYDPKLGKMIAPGKTPRRKALEQWRSYSQRLKLRVIELELELASATAELEGLRKDGNVAVAWLIEHENNTELVPSPLTDDTYMDEGDTAWPLYNDEYIAAMLSAKEPKP
jgi:hypothetical protein